MKNPTTAPVTTYRLQFNDQFTLQHASDLIEYFHKLGISHFYSSPLLKTKKGSKHGYDIIDHSQLNPEIGSEEQFKDFCHKLRQYNMGIICDIVPNHMYIADSSNKWWQDVLENGPSSPYANYFDIDWSTHRKELINKVLLPFLEQPYGEALESQGIKVIYKNGTFFVELPNLELPTDPKSWTLILTPLTQELESIENSSLLAELRSIITALTHLPSTTATEKEKIDERKREKEAIKLRIKKLLDQNSMILDLLKKHLKVLNGQKEDPKSFDQLETFLNVQPYRLSFWRVANDEINYRRFFEIFEYAGIRTENPEVFEATHALIFKFIEKGFIDGVRIDHVDGLWDPEKYLKDVFDYSNKLRGEDFLYMVVEKILIGNEKLIPEWPVQGTVGYDFLNLLNGLFVYQPNREAIDQLYRNFTGITSNTFELCYLCKKLILKVSMSSELNVLSRLLERISEHHRSSRDFTTEGLKSALRDVIACFPVYRSYILPEKQEIHDEDRHYVFSAISKAKRINPTFNSSIFDFIQNILLLDYPTGINEAQKTERDHFVMRFQQLTSPVMAKGIEDTFSYRFYPLASLAEVGANPYSFGTSVENFHKKNIERLESWPHSMLASSTHDNKRSEDVRARINVLSEITDEWKEAIWRWTELNHKHRTLDDDEELIPDANEEYLFYVTLIGTWPLYPMDASDHQQYLDRIQAYMAKAIKEAKVHTSWINPNEKYELNVKLFIQKVLKIDSEPNFFLAEFQTFVKKVIAAGMLNSLSQVVIKLTSPGVPDIYQGNELWDFSLVDPDNRRPVDFSHRQALLNSFSDKANHPDQNLVENLMLTPEDGRIKLYITTSTLGVRQKYPELFSKGTYVPLTIEGEQQEHVIAFARILENKIFLVVVGRFFNSLMTDETLNISPKTWQGTRLQLPVEFGQRRFRDVYTGREFDFLDLDKIFSNCPVALLEG